ncbi:DUF559 domain-containing protein [Rathayibacter sp. VKM Ac-2929]|uniref:endonuclease domain-containing protein n=1 Tax=Rathayibacter sp. VKM Ac-2929 TaxID=2929480 RepID=UPI001FB4FB9D|nr:DUF559 domain-containing protein [Rathayibacter sp. VKM Ac-2929]MCJ1672105.1 DUF559 domain-containing protein [Rathayibacter sp. VKM Ac-2929]
MPRPAPLPPALAGRAFSVQEALAAGVGIERLRASDLEAPFRGVRVPRGQAVTVAQRARAYATVMDGSVFCGITAARLWPLDLPREPPGEPLHVAVRPPAHAPRGRGLVGHSLGDPRLRAVRRGGLLLADGASLFLQLASVLSLEDLVAVGDALVLAPVRPQPGRPWVPLRELRRRVEGHEGRGARAVRHALELVREGAESRRETLLRLALAAAGLPEPELQAELVDADGRIGRVDLLFRRWRVVVEYEGDHHRTDRAQWDRDLIRYERLAAVGWTVVRVASASFDADLSGCTDRVRRALVAGGWRPSR